MYMAKKYRDITNPITLRDWFLYYIFTDEDFVSIRKQWRTEINDIESGEPGKDGLPFREQEIITESYIQRVCDKFKINRDVALKGLRYEAWSRVLNKDRIPTATVDGDRINISIGAETRLEDIEHLWDIYAESLQKKLPAYQSKRTPKAEQPLLAYVIHKKSLDGNKMTHIHECYVKGTLDDRIPAHPESVIEDFRKYYKKVVQGYIN